MAKTIHIPIGSQSIDVEIEIGDDGAVDYGTITSDLQCKASNDDDLLYNSACDGLESLVLAYVCATGGASKEFIEAVNTAVESIGNEY
jgi:hypothetical protein